MTNKIRTILSALVLLCVAFGLASTPASASHLRGTTVSWSPTGVTGQVQFTMQYAQRLSFGGCNPNCGTLGSTIYIPFYFGDGAARTCDANRAWATSRVCSRRCLPLGFGSPGVRTASARRSASFFPRSYKPSILKSIGDPTVTTK